MSTFRRAGLVTSLATAALSFPAVALATPPEVPWWVSTSSMYDPPASSIPGQQGSVVWWRTMSNSDDANLGSLEGAARPDATARRVIFRSTTVGGTPNVESATVFTPNNKPKPADGWKVVAWNHVTTGGADLCAPSRATENLPWSFTANPEYERLTRSDELIAGLLDRGLVVVRTDYEGIGTPGPHPYMVGTSLAKSGINGVRATRDLLGTANTSKKWAVAGHSEGGVAALSTASLAPTLGSDLELQATLAAAPPVDLMNLVFGLGFSIPFPVGGTPMGALLVNGARLSVPAIGAGYPDQILSAAGKTRSADLETKCLAQLGDGASIGGLSFGQYFAPTASNYESLLKTELDRWDPRFLDLKDKPVKFYAGSVDPLAWQSKIQTAVDMQRARGKQNVELEVLPWANHVTITDNAQGGVSMANWIKAQLG